MRLAWQPIFEREWEQNSERFQIGKSLHLKEKRHFCKQALDNPSHGRSIAFFFFQPVVFMELRLVRLRIFLLSSGLRI